MNPLISIVTPIFNCAYYVAETIESVLSQTYHNWELLLIDDGSTDNTDSVVGPYLKEERIKLAKQPHKGLGSGRNHGVALAKGEYICFLDGDDLFLPHKLEVCLKEMGPAEHILYSGMLLIDSQGNEIKAFDPGSGYSRDNFLAQMLFRNLVIPSTVMARGFCAREELSVEGMTGMEEYDLFLRWAEKFTFKYIPQPLIKYRRHGGALSVSPQTAVWKEKELIRSYGLDRIRQIIWRTTYPEQEKQLLYAKILCKIDAYTQALEALAGIKAPLALFYKGNALLALGRPEEAKEAYLKAIELDPQNPAMYNNLGFAYVRLGQLEKAEAQWLRAGQLKPGYMDAEQNLNQLNSPSAEKEFRMTERELRENLMIYRFE